MATVNTVNSINYPVNSVNSINNSAYQVTLRVNGINTTVNVFGSSSADAVNNAKYQTNPNNPSSLGLVSVKPINTCSIVASNVELPQGQRVYSTRNINNINY